MVIDNLSIFGKTVDSVKNTMIDNIHIKGGKAPFVWNDDFHFASETNASGLGLVECNDGVDEPLQSLKISGNTGSSTSNLLGNKTSNYGTYNGLTFQQELNNSFFKVHGISTAAYGAYITTLKNPLFLEVGKTYTFSYEPTDAVLRWEIRFVDLNGVEKRAIALSSGNSISLRVKEGEVGIAITYVLAKYKDFGTVDNPTTIEYMLNEGDTALEYEPFEAVTAVPTKLTVESENYFKVKPFTKTDRGVTMVWDGEFLTLNGTAESDGIVQRFIQQVDRTETATGPVRLTSEYISGTFSNSTAFWVGFYTEDNVSTQSIAVSLANDYRVTKFSLIGNLVGNLFASVKTGYTYNNAKWRIRIEQYEPQTVTIPSDYDMSRGNNVSVDTLNNTVKYNNTDITATEFGQKLLALEAYDGYTRVRVDSNVPIPIETNYWKQIKP